MPAQDATNAAAPAATAAAAGEPRPLVATDAPALWQLDQLCFTSGIAFSLSMFRHLLRAKWLVSQGIPLARTSHPLHQQAMAAFVMALATTGEEAEIVTLDVHPDWRRRGLGRSLLRLLHRQLLAGDMHRVVLHVAVDNLAAQYLYASEQYLRLGIARDYYGADIDAYRMHRILTSV